LFKNIISERSYLLLNIDNKMYQLPIWRYKSKPRGYIQFGNFNKKTPDFSEIVRQ